jgi:hypothetical protein
MAKTKNWLDATLDYMKKVKLITTTVLAKYTISV